MPKEIAEIAKIIKKYGKTYVELPDQLSRDISQHNYMKISKVSSNIYVLFVDNDNNNEKTTKSKSNATNVVRLNEAEHLVLKKLMRIKFVERTVPNVRNTLSPEEHMILKSLISKRFVTVFKSKKYPDGVYNINKSVFTGEKGRYNTNTKKANTKKETSENDLYTKLEKDGYITNISDKGAKYLSYILKKNNKEKEYMGIHGFDNKYYMLNKALFRTVRDRIFSILNEPTNSTQIAKALSMNLELVNGALALLLEEGEIIEKRKGLYVKV